ncbi:hypothetical protein MMC19_001158 [Ptychographa xylographoides]|nr:hypothetical protein [Ptychographa xylographoides]
MAQSTSMVEPAKYGGYGQVKNELFGGLKGCAYPSLCPPSVTNNTIIVAVCGPNDFKDNASPTNDGWFFSDFFLFYHLLKGTASKQIWMTCVKPEILVNKYKEYVHGNPRLIRKVVLDAEMVAETQNIDVYPGKDLLERFLATIAGVSKEVKGTQRPILVLIFGHGRIDTFAITIGGAGEFSSCPALTIQKFKEAVIRHNPDPNIALFTTSCYGGGWVQSPYLNTTAMSGVNRGQELLSWPMTESLSRCCGSRFATGIAWALIKQEIGGIQRTTDEGEDLRQSPTFASLVATIHQTLKEEVDPRESYDISFSAKDDLWGTDYRERTGLPLASFQQRYNTLKDIPEGQHGSSSKSATIRFAESVNIFTPAAEYRLKRMALEYTRSMPGPGAAAKNHAVNYGCRNLLDDKTLSAQELESLSAALIYRLKTITARATEYKDRLGLVYLDCHECDVWTYASNLPKNSERDVRYSEILHMVCIRELFDEPSTDEGHNFSKGYTYLAMVLTESKWSITQIEVALDGLAKFNEEHSRHTFTARHFMFWQDRDVRGLLGTIAQSTKRRLRSRSPTKHPRKSLESAFGRPRGVEGA